MIVFLLIGIAAGLAVWSLLTETVLVGIAALGVALVSLGILATAAVIDRRSPGKAGFDEDSASGNAGEFSEQDTCDHQDHKPETVADTLAESVGKATFPQNLPKSDDADQRAPLHVSPIRVKNDTISVWVIPDMKRFHHRECSSLSGHNADELTAEEAIEEGFTPCSLCRPDDKTTRRTG